MAQENDIQILQQFKSELAEVKSNLKSRSEPQLLPAVQICHSVEKSIDIELIGFQSGYKSERSISTPRGMLSTIFDEEQVQGILTDLQNCDVKQGENQSRYGRVNDFVKKYFDDMIFTTEYREKEDAIQKFVQAMTLIAFYGQSYDYGTVTAQEDKSGNFLARAAIRVLNRAPKMTHRDRDPIAPITDDYQAYMAYGRLLVAINSIIPLWHMIVGRQQEDQMRVAALFALKNCYETVAFLVGAIDTNKQPNVSNDNITSENYQQEFRNYILENYEKIIIGGEDAAIREYIKTITRSDRKESSNIDLARDKLLEYIDQIKSVFNQEVSTSSVAEYEKFRKLASTAMIKIAAVTDDLSLDSDLSQLMSILYTYKKVILFNMSEISEHILSNIINAQISIYSTYKINWERVAPSPNVNIEQMELPEVEQSIAEVPQKTQPESGISKMINMALNQNYSESLQTLRETLLPMQEKPEIADIIKTIDQTLVKPTVPRLIEVYKKVILHATKWSDPKSIQFIINKIKERYDISRRDIDRQILVGLMSGLVEKQFYQGGEGLQAATIGSAGTLVPMLEQQLQAMGTVTDLRHKNALSYLVQRICEGLIRIFNFEKFDMPDNIKEGLLNILREHSAFIQGAPNSIKNYMIIEGEDGTIEAAPNADGAERAYVRCISTLKRRLTETPSLPLAEGSRIPAFWSKYAAEEEWEKMNELEKKSLLSVDITKLAQNMDEIHEVKKELDPMAEAISRALPASATVYVTGQASNSMWTGSGFLMPNRRFITANHVIEGEGEELTIEVVFDDEAQISSTARVGAAYPECDMAVLVLDQDVPVEPMKFAEPDDISIGETVSVIGSPEGWGNVVTSGRIAAINKNLSKVDPAFDDFILIDADIEEGSSGSMVIDIEGNVVGMVVAMIGQKSELGIGKRAVMPVRKMLSVIYKTHEKKGSEQKI